MLKVLNEIKEKRLVQDYAIGGAIVALRWIESFFTKNLDIFILLGGKESEIQFQPIELS